MANFVQFFDDLESLFGLLQRFKCAAFEYKEAYFSDNFNFDLKGRRDFRYTEEKSVYRGKIGIQRPVGTLHYN